MTTIEGRWKKDTDSRLKVLILSGLLLLWEEKERNTVEEKEIEKRETKEKGNLTKELLFFLFMFN